MPLLSQSGPQSQVTDYPPGHMKTSRERPLHTEYKFEKRIKINVAMLNYMVFTHTKL